MSEESLAWKLAVLHKGLCVVTGNRPEQSHHVVTRQKLRKIGREDAWWDARNGVPVTTRAHQRHHSRHAPIPLSSLPPEALEFAAEVLGDAAPDYLRRFYA